MEKFNIAIRSLKEVQEFAALAGEQPFEIIVGNDHQRLNGKDFMGLFCLDYSHPVQVSVQCSQEEYLRFQQKAEKFVV